MDDKSSINLQLVIDNLLDKLENGKISLSQAREIAVVLKAKIIESQAGNGRPNDIQFSK